MIDAKHEVVASKMSQFYCIMSKFSESCTQKCFEKFHGLYIMMKSTVFQVLYDANIEQYLWYDKRLQLIISKPDELYTPDETVFVSSALPVIVTTEESGGKIFKKPRCWFCWI